jgi:uncharacterized protein YuzE
MTVTVSQIPFEARYDAEADVLYLRRVDRSGPAARTLASREGHAVRYDADGEVIGFTIVNARRLIEAHEPLDTPEPIEADELAPALA